MKGDSSDLILLRLLIFEGDIILWDFPRRDFSHVSIRRIFYAPNYPSLEGLALFQ